MGSFRRNSEVASFQEHLANIIFLYRKALSIEQRKKFFDLFSDQYHTTLLIPLIRMQTPMCFYATKMTWQETLVLLGAGALVILINLLGHLSLNMQEMMSLRPRYISKYSLHISNQYIYKNNYT